MMPVPVRNEILLVLTDRWCDWEASYIVAVANAYSPYTVKTIALDTAAKTSMGGIRAMVDYRMDTYQDFSRLALVVLPGGLAWSENRHDEIAAFIRAVRRHAIPVAAICGATTFLSRHGFLDSIRHTGDSAELLQSQQGYHGEALYVPAQVVSDGGIITANETAAVEFAYEIMKLLRLDSDEEMAQWYDTFQNGAVR